MKSQSEDVAEQRCSENEAETHDRFLNKLPRGPLYHYTTAPGLLGIFSSRSLHATHNAYLNDKSEGQYARELIAKAFESYSGPGKAREHLLPEVGVRGLGATEVLALRPYVVSFCEDGDLLSQWRGYGDQGGGYALGFTVWPQGIGQPQQHSAYLQHSEHFILRRIIYEEEEQIAIVHDVINKAVGVLDEASAVMQQPDELERVAQICRLSVMRQVGYLSACLKHPAFRDETEWRAISVRGLHDDIRPEFRLRGSDIIPYIQLPLTADPRSPASHIRRLLNLHLAVSDITIGPGAHPQLAEFALRSMTGLHTQGSHICQPSVKISVSKIPFKQ